ncbi:hypothetical protein C1I99_10765 [Micromonospora deserti]|uniref:Golvesin/Xly CBD-like domain-containing protein n=1 Tax=Micromonospora deserti TaxID=2070366 RepID=A0A2W2CK26_9ACTN|nr:hypothetical protein C1I99_10765 [Micromonospora deserti]
MFQVLQPKPRQVEWAVDQAVTNSLYVQRPANWKNLGMNAYQPQAMFPPLSLVDGGRVPAQVMLGVVAQESNLWQASRLAYPGVTGNPLIGNFYGLIYNDREDDDWTIRWSEADCGYGVAQVTDGMRRAGYGKPGEVIRPWAHQQAIAADFAANVAAGLRILQEKWNLTRSAGMIVNGGSEQGIENWFFALWAYNSGFYPDQGNGSPWGVGWFNNPVNPRYPADRLPFMEFDYSDSSHPQDWPYPEKVIGFAGHPLELIEQQIGDDITYVHAYRPAWWTTTGNRVTAKPPVDLFCGTSNDCDPGNQATGFCLRSDYKCWWHRPAKWKDDNQTGNELLRFDPGYPYQDDASSFPPRCTLAGLPVNARVIDDMPSATPKMRPCANSFTDAGSFSLSIPKDVDGYHPAKIDLHQLGGGFNSHFWFTHTRDSAHDRGGTMRISGTWSFYDPLNGWARLLVHIPDHGAHTQQATYEVDTGTGFASGKKRVILQRTREHRWVSLGVFNFTGTPRIRLSNTTLDGRGVEDVAWDAVALQPLPGKPRHQIVALGESYASGEGASENEKIDYYRETNFKLRVSGQDRYQNACHRSKHAWSRQAVLSDSTASIGQRADNWQSDADYHLLACSGAQTENLLPYYSVPDGQPKPVNAWGEDGGPGHWQYSELSQLDRGFLDENTTLVTLSIGGNDARFADVLIECITNGSGFANCKDSTLDGDAKPLEQASPQRIAGPIRNSILKVDPANPNNGSGVLWEIHKKAPHAKILLMGYPKIFNDQDGYTANCTWGITGLEEIWMGEQGDLLAQMLRDVADDATTHGIPTYFANPIPAFHGKEACGNPESIHTIVYGKTSGESTTTPWYAIHEEASVQSFHPKVSGAAIYARVMESVVRNQMGL